MASLFAFATDKHHMDAISAYLSRFTHFQLQGQAEQYPRTLWLWTNNNYEMSSVSFG